MISCNNAVKTPVTMLVMIPIPQTTKDRPNECHNTKANSGTCSRFLLSSSRAVSRRLGFRSCAIHSNVRLLSSAVAGSLLPNMLGWCSVLFMLLLCGGFVALALLNAAMRPKFCCEATACCCCCGCCCCC